MARSITRLAPGQKCDRTNGGFAAVSRAHFPASKSGQFDVHTAAQVQPTTIELTPSSSRLPGLGTNFPCGFACQFAMVSPNSTLDSATYDHILKSNRS
jgi:hypothetical protein